MGVMGIQWLIATLAYFGFLLAGFTWLRNRTNLNQTIPTTNERLAQYQRLLADFPLTPENAQAPNAAPPPANAPPPQAPDVSDKEPKTAEMLLDQSKIAYDRMFADRSSMETRAGTLVGLAAAATGAYRLHNRRQRHHVHTTARRCRDLCHLVPVVLALYLARKIQSAAEPRQLRLYEHRLGRGHALSHLSGHGRRLQRRLCRAVP